MKLLCLELLLQSLRRRGGAGLSNSSPAGMGLHDSLGGRDCGFTKSAALAVLEALACSHEGTEPLDQQEKLQVTCSSWRVTCIFFWQPGTCLQASTASFAWVKAHNQLQEVDGC